MSTTAELGAGARPKGGLGKEPCGSPGIVVIINSSRELPAPNSGPRLADGQLTAACCSRLLVWLFQSSGTK